MSLMIKPFRHTGLEDFFYTASKKKIKPDHANKLTKMLDNLNAANDLEARL